MLRSSLNFNDVFQLQSTQSTNVLAPVDHGRCNLPECACFNISGNEKERYKGI